jgi:hypothetical protein
MKISVITSDKTKFSYWVWVYKIYKGYVNTKQTSVCFTKDFINKVQNGVEQLKKMGVVEFQLCYLINDTYNLTFIFDNAQNAMLFKLKWRE